MIATHQVQRDQPSEVLFRAIFNNPYDFIMILTPGGEILQANRTAQAVCNTPESSLQSLFLWDVLDIDQEMKERLRHEVAECAAAHFSRLELALGNMHGQPRPWRFSLRPVFEGYDLVNIIAEGRDLSRL